jgi:putative tricarboxylic transport membrane protein
VQQHADDPRLLEAAAIALFEPLGPTVPEESRPSGLGGLRRTTLRKKDPEGEAHDAIDTWLAAAMSRGMRRGWQVTACVILLLCLFVMWQSIRLSLIDRLGPGPGFFPFWLAVIGAALAAVIFVQTTLQGANDDDELVFPRDAAALARLAAIVGISLLASALLEPLGYRLTALLYVPALVVSLGERRWWVIALVALAGSFGIFQVFNNWLDVILPQGLLEQWLGL